MGEVTKKLPALVTKSWYVLETTKTPDATEFVELADTDYGWAVRIVWTDEYNRKQYTVTQYSEQRMGPGAYAAACNGYRDAKALLA